MVIDIIGFIHDADYNLAHRQMKKRRIYTKMDLEERKIMQNLLKKGHNFPQIARLLNVSTIL